jgi:bifunctional DNase/RNase
MMIEMKVTGLTIDPFTDMPILILKDTDGKHAVPIWIGLLEASAIATELEKVELRRPMTHDLMVSAIDKLGGRLVHVEVHDLRENTFFARVCLQIGANLVELDSRPSDAIALALRAGSPILVAPEVVEQVGKRQPGDRAASVEGPAGLDLRRLEEEAAAAAEAVVGDDDDDGLGDDEIDVLALPEPSRTKGRARRSHQPAAGDETPPRARRRTGPRSGWSTSPANLDDEACRLFLESLSDEDFGKWKM